MVSQKKTRKGIGPITEETINYRDKSKQERTICSEPGIGANKPPKGSRKVVGLIPYRPGSLLDGFWRTTGRGKIPLLAAGERIDPPISVPIPKHDPLNPSKAPSPPELPPAVKVVLNGFVVTLAQRLISTTLPLPKQHSLNLSS